MTESVKNNNQVCVRCTVAGQVQGVFFRASAREEALRLGIAGHARNLPDGRVEVLACGDLEAVNSLREWLRRGPPLAQVTGVACEAVEQQAVAGFTVVG
ncbi:MAG: acylphosphatase [Thiohalocapsa sp.]|jgi:acylphosphatase|uniref:acylphosphatase n=1 Tax=Thiohalocapsa sp. TaxID=2497641 RepID=UPI0025F8F607|nr:acylphosphatase [Thiohalocapsa sp.]MCG6943052.1 acylphosphatase [Thiohalocapsa sp.]